MSQPCAITTCKRASRALCYCCQQSLCLQHLKEHNDLLLSQLNPLVDQINGIGDRLKAINMENKIGDCRQELEHWRKDCHKKIDDFFEQKCQDINQRITRKMEEQRRQIDEIQLKMAALLREEEVSRQDIDLLTSTIQNLDQEVNKIEHSDFSIETRPIIIDDNWIHIQESNINRFDLAKMSPVCKTIEYIGESSVPLTSNDRFLLMHRFPDLCLIDRNFKIAHQITWDYGIIRDMCWSSSLDRFIIISDKGVFSVDDRAMSINKLQIVQERKWSSCTCSDTSVFLSTYQLASSIIEYKLLPSMQFTKEWKSPVTCQKEEWINNMKYIRGSIVLLINNTSEKRLSIELRNVNTLDRLWSCQWNIPGIKKRAFHYCLLDDEEWLVMDNESDRLVSITKDGKIKSTRAYDGVPWCATLFGPDTIAISTNKSVNFHKF